MVSAPVIVSSRENMASPVNQEATVVIAQRVSSILSLDEILVLHEGEMIGRGTHAELMESCPEYRDICLTQMKEGE
jgi:ATP-binding cassette subfamily B protein